MVDREYEKMIVHSAIYDRIAAIAKGQPLPIASNASRQSDAKADSPSRPRN